MFCRKIPRLLSQNVRYILLNDAYKAKGNSRWVRFMKTTSGVRDIDLLKRDWPDKRKGGLFKNLNDTAWLQEIREKYKKQVKEAQETALSWLPQQKDITEVTKELAMKMKESEPKTETDPNDKSNTTPSSRSRK